MADLIEDIQHRAELSRRRLGGGREAGRAGHFDVGGRVCGFRKPLRNEFDVTRHWQRIFSLACEAGKQWQQQKEPNQAQRESMSRNESVCCRFLADFGQWNGKLALRGLAG